MLVAYMRCCTAQVIRSIFPQSFTARNTLAPFLASASATALPTNISSYQQVEIACSDVGFAPRDLDRSLMSRQSFLQSGPECDVRSSFSALCQFVFACTNILAVRVDVNGSN